MTGELKFKLSYKVYQRLPAVDLSVVLLNCLHVSV